MGYPATAATAPPVVRAANAGRRQIAARTMKTARQPEKNFC
jgi:hypothetical protein